MKHELDEEADYTPNPLQVRILEEYLLTPKLRAKLLAALAAPARLRIGCIAVPTQAFKMLWAGQEDPEGAAEEFEFTCKGVVEIPKEDTPKVEPLAAMFHRTKELLEFSLAGSMIDQILEALEKRAVELPSASLSEEAMSAVFAKHMLMNTREYVRLRKQGWFSSAHEYSDKWDMAFGKIGVFKNPTTGEAGDLLLSRVFPAGTILGCNDLGSMRITVVPIRLDRTESEITLELKVVARVFWADNASVKKWVVADSPSELEKSTQTSTTC